MDSFRSIALGTVCVPAFVVVYLGLLGYRGFSTPETLVCTILWGSIPLAVLGGLLGVAVSRRLTVTVATVATSVLVVPAVGDSAIGPWLSTGRAFGLASTFFLTWAIGLAGLEWALGNHGTVVRSPASGRLRWYATAGFTHLSFVFGAGAWIGLWEVHSFLDELLTITHPLEFLLVGLILVLVAVATFLLGAVPAVAFARWRLVFPSVFVVLVLGETVRRTWVYAQWSTNQFGHTPSPLEAYVVLCFVPLAGSVCVAFLEHRLLAERRGL